MQKLSIKQKLSMLMDIPEAWRKVQLDDGEWVDELRFRLRSDEETERGVMHKRKRRHPIPSHSRVGVD